LIDACPHLLRRSYHLRYDVYCLERKFLQACNYPDRLETDEYDQYSMHFGITDAREEMVGTVRLVQPGPVGLPLYNCCEIFPHEAEKLAGITSIAEISRLAISRRFHRRLNDGPYGLRGAERFGEDPDSASHDDDGVDERHGHVPLVVSLYKAMYQACKRNGITHLLAATERSLQRLLTVYHFPFRIIGPQVNYFGPVAPYILDLAELDARLIQYKSPILREFLKGLEPEYWPAMATPVPRAL
jgi:N-acyl amino acid synthase of PEP-CTERM/exosortase system